MTDVPPDRFRPAESVDEHIAELRAKRRGQAPPQFETAEYKRRRADALRAAGLVAEADEAEPAGEPDPDSLGVAEHLGAIRSDWQQR